MEIFRPRFDFVCGNKICKGGDLNRNIGAENLPRKVKLDRNSVVDMSFTASVIGFLDGGNNESTWNIKENLNQLRDCNHSQECLFFASSLCVAILLKMNQSSENFLLSDSLT